jgi:dTDP-N-acetylfucosamine:lipid II N-acetylfucosaminyltransferase
LTSNNPHIIHVFNDDKFVDPAISIMELAYPNGSEYFVIKNTEGLFKYVKSDKPKSIALITSEDFSAFVKYLIEQKAEVVFFHALDSYKQKLVNLLPEDIVKVWLVWGYDLYGNWQLFDNNLYEKETKKYLLKDKVGLKSKLIYSSFSFWLFHKTLHKKIRLPKRVLFVLQSSFYQDFYQAAEKIDLVAPVIASEFEFIKKLKIKAKLMPFSYGCLEDLLQDNASDTVLESRNILIGNSADPSNNHLEVFKKIASFNFGDRKIFVPLSYGGNKEYIEYIVTKGKELFGDNFVPLLDFMTLKEYNTILSSCGFMIFNHIRQQGVGNIVSLGYMGAKLFLNRKSPILSFFSNKGMTILDANKITEAQLFKNLDSKQLVINRQVLIEEYSSKAVTNKILTLVEMVKEQIAIKQNK